MDKFKQKQAWTPSRPDHNNLEEASNWKCHRELYVRQSQPPIYQMRRRAYEKDTRIYVRHGEEEECGEFSRFLGVELRKMSYNVVVSAHHSVPFDHLKMLAVLFVLSDGFFKNEHCLLDLVDLKRGQVPLIPLFYRLSVPEFRSEERRQLWREEWKSRAQKGSQDMARCEQAVEILDSCQGIEYSMTASSITQDVQAVAEAVSSRVPLQVYWSEESSKVVGRTEMCESVNSSFGTTSLLGLWGIWGVGKSALAKALCDFYSPEFGGRVYYVELGSTPLPDSRGVRLHRLKQILKNLFEISDDFLGQQVRNLGQAHAYLDYCLGHAFKKVFLVVDNIQDSPQSFEEARDLFLRKAPFPEGSKVLLLARSSHTLEKLLLPVYGKFPNSVIKEFPGLSSSDAYYPIWSCGLSEFQHRSGLSKFADHRSEFDGLSEFDNPSGWSEFDHGSEYDNPNGLSEFDNPSGWSEFDHGSGLSEIDHLLGLSEIDHQSRLSKFRNYICMTRHPLTIQSVAGFISRLNDRTALRDSQSGILDKVFETLQKTFQLLNPKEQQFFLDVALFMPRTNIRQLRHLHDSPDELFSTTSKCLRKLRSEALLTIKGREIQMPVACRYFANWMVQKLLGKKMMYITRAEAPLHKLSCNLSLNDPKFLQRLAFESCNFEACTVDLSSCKYLRVLRLWGNNCSHLVDDTLYGKMTPPPELEVQVGKSSMLSGKMTPLPELEVQLGESSMLESVEILQNRCPVAVTGDLSFAKCLKGDNYVVCSAAGSERNVKPCLQVLEIYVDSQCVHALLGHFGKCINLDILRLHGRLLFHDPSVQIYSEDIFDKNSEDILRSRQFFHPGLVKSKSMKGGKIDLSGWINLSELVLEDVKNLRQLCGLHKLRNLRVLRLGGLIDLVSLPGTKALSKLEEFHLQECSSLSHLRLPGSKVLSHCCIYECERLKYIEVEAAGQSSDYNEEDDEEFNEDRLWLQNLDENWSGPFINLDSLQNLDENWSGPFINLYGLHSHEYFRKREEHASTFNYGDGNKLTIHGCPHLGAVKGASKLTAIQVFEHINTVLGVMESVTALAVSYGRSALFLK